MKAYEIAGKGSSLDLALRTSDHREFGLFSDDTVHLLTTFVKEHNDVLAWEEVALELIEHGVHCRS